MTTIEIWTDEKVEDNPRVKKVFDDIRATRKSDFVNNIWRGLANQPKLLEETWEKVKAVMIAPGTLDPLTRELVYIAVSAANGCGYCVHSHTAAAKQKGMTSDQHGELLAIVSLASQTNALATLLQIPIDDAFLVV
jgi:AhpD family alkylhydroperoxidase